MSAKRSPLHETLAYNPAAGPQPHASFARYHSGRSPDSLGQWQLLMTVRALALTVLAVAISGCGGMGEVDYTSWSRAGWQRPDRVMEALALEPGERVADLGSGQGFFLPYLSAAVGPGGLVYAVEVEPELETGLRKRVTDDSLANVEIVLADYDDSRLPESSVDVVLIVNTYHHIEDRPSYFTALASKLRPGGRVAIIEHDANQSGFLSLFITKGHASTTSGIESEMESAGYRRAGLIDTLPLQLFEIWRQTVGTHGTN